MSYYWRIEGVAFKGHHVPETKAIQDVLDSRFHSLNSGGQVMDYGSLLVELGFPIPIIWGIPDSKPQDSGLHKQKFPGFPSFMAVATQSGADSKKFVPKTFSKSDISDLAIKFQAFIGDNSHSWFGPVILIPAIYYIMSFMIFVGSLFISF